MTDAHWAAIKEIVARRTQPTGGTGSVGGRRALLAAFIIDSPWLPNWRGMHILDYFESEELWFDANRAAVELFPDAAFIPGFWAEYGMCTEPSAFGARSSFPENEFPHAHPVIRRVEDIDDLVEPDPAKDGLLPFVLKRMERALPRMEALGHRVRFSVSRGPLNVASYLMGMTDFLVALKTEPDRAKSLLSIVTSFLERWHAIQRERFPSIEGVMILDDIVGFLGEEDFLEFARPYLARLFAVDVPVKLFHNDADCGSSIAHYADIGINLYNPGTKLPLAELHARSAGRLAILGCMPPRDVLAAAAPAEVAAELRRQISATPTDARVILSCAGGMPPGVSDANLRAFLAQAARAV